MKNIILILSFLAVCLVPNGFCQEKDSTATLVFGYLGNYHLVDLKDGSAKTIDTSRMTPLEVQALDQLHAGDVLQVEPDPKYPQDRGMIAILSFKHVSQVDDVELPPSEFAPYINDQQFLASLSPEPPDAISCDTLNQQQQILAMTAGGTQDGDQPERNCQKKTKTTYCGCYGVVGSGGITVRRWYGGGPHTSVPEDQCHDSRPFPEDTSKTERLTPYYKKPAANAADAVQGAEEH